MGGFCLIVVHLCLSRNFFKGLVLCQWNHHLVLVDRYRVRGGKKSWLVDLRVVGACPFPVAIARPFLPQP